MPLYLYTCRTCELEMEELYPLGQAPERGIRCPLCGGYFMREIARVNIGATGRPAATRPAAAETPHGINCPCCSPTPRRSGRG
jgi:putative FmdB family regulatory protein